MQKWLVSGWLAIGCGLVACSAASDMGGGQRVPSFGASGSGGVPVGGTNPNGNAGRAGSDGFGNSTMPVGPIEEPVSTPGAMDAGGECGAVSQMAQNTLQPVDIIIGVDTSGSMDEEIVFVQQNLNTFSQQITDSGIDVHVIMLATEGVTMMGGGLFGGGLFGGGDSENAVCIGPPLGSGQCPGDSNPPVYTHIDTEVGSNDVLGVFVNAYPQYKASLREGSLKTFVSVTDDDATDGPHNSADAFINAINALEPAGSTMWSNWRYSGIYCLTECEDAAAIGAVHADLVARTMGVGGDLCLQDFAPVFDALAKSVIGSARLDCEWAIPAVPDGQTFQRDRVNVEYTPSATGAKEAIYHVESASQCGAQGGWFYDDNAAPQRLRVCPSTCERLQADSSGKLDVLFGCRTKDGPD